MAEWQYTLTDLGTGLELATLPLTEVKYGLALSGAGPVDAFLSLRNAVALKNNPWAATRPRRCGLWVEFEDNGQTDVVWSGPIYGRDRSDDRVGLVLSGASWESWLARQQLTATSSTTSTAVGNATHLMGRIAAQPGALEGGFGVRNDGPGPTAPLVPRIYEPRELRDVLELLDQLTDTGTPSEYRVHAYREAGSGRLRRELVVGEPRIGRRYEATPVTFAYPNGGLRKWKYTEDEAAVPNRWQVVGSGSGPVQPFVQLSDIDLGLDEIASGYPASFGTQQESQEEDPLVLVDRGETGFRRARSGALVLSGLKVLPTGPPRLGSYWPGDDLGFEITQESFPEYPAALTVVARLLGMTVTPNTEGGITDVSLAVGAAP